MIEREGEGWLRVVRMLVTRQPSEQRTRPALTHRSDASSRRQHRDRIAARACSSAAMEFFNVLTGPELLELTEAHLPEHRERLYPPTVTLAMFVRQALAADPYLPARRGRLGREPRRRRPLPAERSHRRVLSRPSAAAAADAAGPDARDRPAAQCPSPCCVALAGALREAAGRHRFLDARYGAEPSRLPQLACQAQGVGFPLARLSAVICLGSGALLEAAAGPHRGAGHTSWICRAASWARSARVTCCWPMRSTPTIFWSPT